MNIIITGASRGIGFEAAKLFSSGKENKILCIARNEFRGENPNRNIFSVEFDFLNGNVEKVLIPEIKKHFSSVDILINNAATLILKDFAKLNAEDWKSLFAVNLFSPVLLIKHLIPMMGKNSRGHIVNISSLGGYQGTEKFPGLSAYSASKGALAILTECLAVELKGKNIAVNCLCPGGAKTEMFEKAFPKVKAGMSAKQMAEKIVDFSTNGQLIMTGKILPVTDSFFRLNQIKRTGKG